MKQKTFFIFLRAIIEANNVWKVRARIHLYSLVSIVQMFSRQTVCDTNQIINESIKKEMTR